MLNHIFNHQAKTVTFAAVLLGASALISRLLGLVRDRFLASRFGAGEELDIYFAAFRIPDFVYALLIVGGISAVFLPVFAEYFSRDQKEAWRLTNNVFNCFSVFLVFFSVLLAIFTPWLIKFIAPGFTPEQKSLAVSLTRIMFFSPVFLGLSSIFSGVLHYFNNFLSYALAPVLYNLGIILGIVVLYPVFGLSGLAYGVILGAFLHLIIQVPAARALGFKYAAVFDYKAPGLIKIFHLMIPRTFGIAVQQLNLFIITAIASTLSLGSITIFNLANNLQHFPTGIIGVSLATAVFPNLSRAWANGVRQEFLKHFLATFRKILFWIFPISILMFLLRNQIVQIIFSNGEFGPAEASLTAASLGLFCLGIFTIAFIPFLVRVFFAFQDTKTPVFVGIGIMTSNVILSLIFVWLLSHENTFQAFFKNIFGLQDISDIAVIGLPLALSISSFFHFFSLLFILKKKVPEIDLKTIGQYARKIILASFLMAVVVYLVLQVTAELVDPKAFFGALTQSIVVVIVGIPAYFLIFFFAEFLAILNKFKNR